MGKVKTKDFFDILIGKIQKMTHEDFQEIENRKSEFFSSLKDMELNDDNFRLLEIVEPINKKEIY